MDAVVPAGVAGRSGRAGPPKSIFDPVHGPIRLDRVALALVATPEFQRLWGIRQTGFAHLVFPGANHTRLEHSLGTFWVATQIAERLRLDRADAGPVACGALLHDLGHGPFSHTLDAPMRETTGSGHEAISRALIEGVRTGEPDVPGNVPAVLERFGIRPRTVADLVDSRSPNARPRLLREILHGPIDADRLDYLQRDAHYTGVAHGAIDAVRLFDTIGARDDRLVFAEKGRGAVEGFLVGRALMYHTVYYHHTVRAAETMAQAAVERRPGYPEAARALFGLTDGDLLADLARAGGRSAELVLALRERRLYKRVHAVRSVPPRGGWVRLVRDPPARRLLEDEIAARLRARPGELLIDLAGLDRRRDPADDWGRVALVDGDRTSYPFRGRGPWQALVARPVADRAVSVFAAPRIRAAAVRYLARDPSILP